MDDDIAAPAGERDLAAILAALTVARRDGTWVVCEVDPRHVPDLDLVSALVVEDEATTIVVGEQDAVRLGLVPRFRAAWLTVEVATALDGVGLTAVLAGALAEHGLPCNVLAGSRHDHLLVPVDRADEALAALRSLRTG